VTAPRVALFKSAGRAEGFAQAIRDAGGDPVLVSPFRCEDHADAVPCLHDALTSGATWAVATSPHAAPALARVLTDGFDVRVAAVGPGTAGALHTSGVRTRLVGSGGGAELAQAMIAAGCGGTVSFSSVSIILG
jgi:uroporphyrinogen-III synthase